MMPNRYDGLDTIARLLDVERFRLGDWDEHCARLYAIDCASIVYRCHLPDLTDTARDLMQHLLLEALRLVRADRANELGSIERALMIGLETASTMTRPAWLVALNAILPDPFRAAVMTTGAALHIGGRSPNPRRDAVAGALLRRILSRTEESALLGSLARLQRTSVTTRLDVSSVDLTALDAEVAVTPVPDLTLGKTATG